MHVCIELTVEEGLIIPPFSFRKHLEYVSSIK